MGVVLFFAIDHVGAISAPKLTGLVGGDRKICEADTAHRAVHAAMKAAQWLV